MVNSWCTVRETLSHIFRYYHFNAWSWKPQQGISCCKYYFSVIIFAKILKLFCYPVFRRPFFLISKAKFILTCVKSLKLWIHKEIYWVFYICQEKNPKSGKIISRITLLKKLNLNEPYNLSKILLLFRWLVCKPSIASMKIVLYFK